MARLLTVGHGNLEPRALLALLRTAGVLRLVDIRSRPGSRRHPHFSRGAMAAWLGEGGIEYLWMGGPLGGFRHARSDSPHSALESGFRGYADHMEAPEFGAALDELLSLADDRTTAAMCAEGDWRGCHRSFLCDAASRLRGAEVAHLRPDGSTEPHALNPVARVDGGRLVYDVDPRGAMLPWDSAP